MFTRITWIALLASGVTLFLASMLIEAAVLAAFLPTALAGFALAGALEVAKATIVVLRRVAAAQARGLLGSWMLRMALIGFSALCSVMFLAQTMHQPGREVARAAELERLDERHQATMSRFQRQADQDEAARRAAVKARDLAAMQALDSRYGERVAALEAELSTEMDNVIGGVFEGPRYRALTQRIETAKADYRAATTELHRAQSAEATAAADRALADQYARRSALESEYEARRQSLIQADFNADPRAENPTVRKFLEVLGAVMSPAPDAVWLVFVFSVGLALLMELGIYVAFDTLALAWAPLFQAAHRADLAVETQRIEAERALRSEDVEDGYVRRRTTAKRRHAEARAEAAASAAIDGAIADA